MDPRQVEALETLDGSRGARQAKGKAAVRLDDLAGLLQIPEKLKSAKAAGDPPTEAEFNALVDDVQRLHAQLAVVAAALQRRILP